MARADGTKVIARNAAMKTRPIDEEGRFTGEGVAGLTFDAIYTKLRGTDVSQTATLQNL